MNLISPAQFAASVGVTRQSVHEAIRAGRLSTIEGKLDPAVARIQWETNRKRKRADAPPGASTQAMVSAALEADPYWSSKARREAAEAELAELRAAELRGELVRKAVVEREISSRLVALRESLFALADRLGAMLAAQSDPIAVRRMLRDEHHTALASFAAQLDDLEDDPDGRT
jgi:hypothetical protein